MSEALAITGTYGTGKSTLAAQIGDILDASSVRYAAIDLDWLTWFDDHRSRPHDDRSMLLRNLASVVDNYRSIDVDHFVVALALTSADELALLTETMGMPVRTVELVVPIDVIERRLESDPSSGRSLDLEEARRWAIESKGSGFADLVVDNTRDIRVVADEVLVWLGWLH
ncbi:MAG TPA: hypothetical protein VFS66_01630 [Acidimicrobiia bacterium]|nr:hypothetical protein [Acidimicrobiia bacterium]